MKKHFIIFLSVAMVGTIPAIAQNEKDTYDAFRKEIKESFHTFRKKALDDYDKYLEGVWKEYNAFRGEERSDLPKPGKAPVAATIEKEPVIQNPHIPDVQPKPSTDEYTGTYRPKMPIPPAQPTVPDPTWSSFNFYGITIRIPQVETSNCPASPASKDFAMLWKQFSGSKIENIILPPIIETATTHGFNDWFTFELIRTYANSIFATVNPGVRISLIHYLLAHLGYDVRIGLKDTGQPMLLVAFKQTVYARSFTMLNGQRYYAFYDSQDATDIAKGFSFYTCDIPREADTGKAMDLIIRQDIKMPDSPHHYSFKHGNIKIEGKVNANVMKLLYHYPQMPVSCYACSVINQSVRDEVTGQLQRQLADMPQREAVDSLLQFVQSAFQYATDDEQHGFEKPYFFEEILYYPQCDCEDRSIFYSYLLWQTLKAENHLVGYPGHECVAVHLDTPVQGCHYRYKGKEFYISDPTYIGAVTGMCMPDYLDKEPEIEIPDSL